ncbi:hypothetical protein [Streptomyces zhihengii]
MTVNVHQGDDDGLDYERYLAPGHKPEDDDPKVLRARIAAVRDLHHPVTVSGRQVCGGCSVQRTPHRQQAAWVALIPHPCPTTRALDGAAGDQP